MPRADQRREVAERMRREAPGLIEEIAAMAAVFGLPRFPESRITLKGERAWPPEEER